MGRSTIVTISKIGYLVIVCGFFYPIILNQNGFELVKYFPDIQKYIYDINSLLSLIGVNKINLNLTLINICFHLIFILPCIGITLFILFKILKVYYDTYIDIIILLFTIILIIILYIEIIKIINIFTNFNEYIDFSYGIIQGAPYIILIGLSFSIIFSVVSIFEKRENIEGLKEFKIINIIKVIFKIDK